MHVSAYLLIYFSMTGGVACSCQETGKKKSQPFPNLINKEFEMFPAGDMPVGWRSLLIMRLKASRERGLRLPSARKMHYVAQENVIIDLIIKYFQEHLTGRICLPKSSCPWPGELMGSGLWAHCLLVPALVAWK